MTEWTRVQRYVQQGFSARMCGAGAGDNPYYLRRYIADDMGETTECATFPGRSWLAGYQAADALLKDKHEQGAVA